MDIFSVPAEVIDGSVLPYLEWNDLLRFRRVCKWTKAITDGYLKVHPELAPELEINEGEKSFGAFLEMGIPSNKIFLNNFSGNGFYEEAGEDGTEFLEQFGAHVKSLRVMQISLLICGKEWDFLVALKNLESFEAECYGGYHRGLTISQVQEALRLKEGPFMNDPRTHDKDGNQYAFPPTVLKQLKKLKIGNNDLRLKSLFEYSYSFMSFGESLEQVGLPVDPYKKPKLDFSNPLDDTPMGFYFPLFLATIKKMEMEPLSSRLKVVDFFNYHDAQEEDQVAIERGASIRFLQLCSQCAKDEVKVKLMNVAAGWFFERNAFMNSSNLGAPVVSMINIHPSMLSLSMSNLEKVEIRSTRRSSPGINWPNERQEWPSLKVLDITVDSTGSCYSERNHTPQPQPSRYTHYQTTTEELFDFFFQGVSRTWLAELNLHFTKKGLPVPKTEPIVSSCPNLKKLSLNNWLGTNKALTRLWAGLPNLEEVSLKYCKALGNVAFVGEDVKSPVFWNLKKLKKLTLGGLDCMPKVTDTLFSLVIRHMKLTHLTLVSDAPIKSVTLTGIRSLCEGAFAESIEKFPFSGWWLSDVTSEEFKQHEMMFRAYYMR